MNQNKAGSRAQSLAEVLTGLDAPGRSIVFLQSGGGVSRFDYADLVARARGLLGLLQKKGLRPGDAVILFVRDSRAFVDVFWACQLGGLIPVPLSAGVHAEYLHKLQSVAERLVNAALVTQRDLWQRLSTRQDAKRRFAARLLLLEEITAFEIEGALHSAQPSDTALIQFSSGSTSEPKGVVLSHANLLANVRAISEAAAIAADDSTLSWMPLSHDMGLIGFHLVPLCHGLDQVIMDTDLFVRRPAEWLQAAYQYRSTLLCAPNFGYQHYLKSVSVDQEPPDLSRIRLIFNGAEPVSAAVAQAFATRLAPRGLKPNSLYPVYGLAEASLAATFPEPGSGIQSIRLQAEHLHVGEPVRPASAAGREIELVYLGYPVPGCQLRIVDEQELPLADGVVGHVHIRGENVTQAYIGLDALETRARNIQGWLDTGDLGFLGAKGLVITGRAREVIFVSGQNWYPQDLDLLLQENAGIEAGKLAVAALRDAANAEDQLLVFVQHRKDVESFIPVVSRVRGVLTEQTGLVVHAVIPIASLPRTTSGKLQRYRLVEAFEQGEYDELLRALGAAPPHGDEEAVANEIEQQLLDVCKQVFPEQEIGCTQNLFELGADSLMLVRIHEEIEARFPGRVEITDLFDYPTIRDLAAYLLV